MVKVDIRGTIALRPIRMTPTSTTGSVHKEVITGGTTNHVHHELASNDKILENNNSNLEGLTSSLKIQLSLNKIFENQLAQISTTIPANYFEKKNPRATRDFIGKC